jgi:hypothetical protein
MSTFRSGEIVYTTTIGSDVDRDGFYAELCRETEQGRFFVTEAFWSDATSSFVVTVAENPVPFSVMELFMAEARSRVPPAASPQEENRFVQGAHANGT